MRPLTTPFLTVLLAAPLSAQLTLLDDFTSGTDLAWTRVDSLQVFALGQTSYTVPAGRYRVASMASVPAQATVVSTGSMFADSVLRAPHYSSGRFRALVRMENTNTGVTMVMRYDHLTYSGYSFAADNVLNAIFISRTQNNTLTVLGQFAMNIANNTDYLLEAEALGCQLSLRCWPTTGTAPLLPQVSVCDTMFAQGGVGLAVYNQATASGGTGGVLAGQFDDVWFTPYAQVTAYGQGCPGSWNQTPALTITGQPSAMQVMNFRLAGGAPGSFAVLILGFLPMTSIPLSPQCSLLIGNPMPGSVGFVLDGTGTWLQPLQIPAWLTAGTFLAQGFVADPPVSFAASQGIRLDFIP